MVSSSSHTLFLFFLFFVLLCFARCSSDVMESEPLRVGKHGRFRILQVADMHFANGKPTGCLDVLPFQEPTCTDLNTTAFARRLIRHEKPDLIVFTGDNIYGADTKHPKKSMDMAFVAATEVGIPWAAVLGNHDQESTLTREGLMKYIVGMPHARSHVNPSGLGYKIDGFGNFNLEVKGVADSRFSNKSVVNLYFLDSGDYSTVPWVFGYGWIKPSQQLWFQQTSKQLQKEYMSKSIAQKESAPGLVYFHIPLPEYSLFDASNMTGVKQEEISSPSVNSGFFTTMVEAGDVKAVFTGHDHINDFCGELNNIHLCYAGGFGYHAYGKAGWSRRARIVDISLGKDIHGNWEGVKSIKTRKHLDDEKLSTIDVQVLWKANSGGRRRKPIYSNS